MIGRVEALEEGPACLLFTKEFYSLVRDRLTGQGAITMQAGMTKVNEIFFYGAIYRTLREVFPVVAPYGVPIPSFALPWGFTLASKNRDPRKFTPQEVDDMIKKRIKGENRFYDGITNLGLFNLPKHIRKALAEQKQIIEDNAPLFTYH